MSWTRLFDSGKLFGVSCLAALACAQPALSRDLTVVSYGGVTNETFEKVWLGPFTEETGISAVMDTWSGDLAKVRAMVESGNIVWDVMDATAEPIEIGCEQGLFEKVGDDPLFTEAGLIKGGLTECGIGSMTYATILAYKNGIFPEGPTAVTDIFDTETYPGKRGLRKSPVDALELALIADGVAVDDVYATLSTPEGVDRAFAKLDTIKDDIIWWEASAQPPQLLMSGQVVMSTSYNARAALAISNDNADLTMVWANNVTAIGFFGIPKGTENLEEAKKFIAFTLLPQVNAAFSDYQPYGPTVTAAGAFVKPDVLPNLPAGHIDEDSLVFDGGFWATQGDALIARFSSWVAQ
ncbi:ABC transporter substrate-binding protein [Salipiger sp. P9]|uniref:ABC transporter substrate-binding protein n=1 Tax=Salipiger pentaromativorans TaxID=2943193 RepID=UPI002157B399|nr:ABC transporter substrate-binding protein [Salipiger pentaromativorans]MCR8548146.1 ABC transporter substrate-binding protein [Salipiger pentaromativorans]